MELDYIIKYSDLKGENYEVKCSNYEHAEKIAQAIADFTFTDVVLYDDYVGIRYQHDQTPQAIYSAT